MRAIAPRCFSLLLAAGVFALALGACSRSGTGVESTSGDGASASTLASLQVDQDSDGASARGYYDGDDGEVRLYGRPAGAADAAAIAAVVKRYYAAAAAGDAGTACALTYYVELESLPERFASGPLWLKSAHTCRETLGRLFAHFHSELTVSPVVTAVRVQNERARALVGFRALGAGYVELHREGSAWKVEGLLAEQLP